MRVSGKVRRKSIWTGAWLSPPGSSQPHRSHGQGRAPPYRPVSPPSCTGVREENIPCRRVLRRYQLSPTHWGRTYTRKFCMCDTSRHRGIYILFISGAKYESWAKLFFKLLFIFLSTFLTIHYVCILYKGHLLLTSITFNLTSRW